MQGCYTAIITPFKNGEIDFSSLENIIRHQVKAQMDGVVPCGTTGESPTLSHEEHREVIRFTIEKTKELNKKYRSKTKVIAGAGSNSTEEAVGIAQDSERLGADAVMIVSPYYNKPTQNGLFKHFEKIAKSISVEVMVYNIPSRTGILIDVDTMVKICSIANINTVKEATGNIDYTGALLARAPKVDILSGNDSMNLPIYSLGGKGCVSVMGNIMPTTTKKIYTLFKSGKSKAASDLHLKIWALNEALFLETNPIPIKEACLIRGLISSGELRLPLLPPTKLVKDRLRKLLKELKALR